MFAPPRASGACLSLAVLGRQLRLGQLFTSWKTMSGLSEPALAAALGIREKTNEIHQQSSRRCLRLLVHVRVINVLDQRVSPQGLFEPNPERRLWIKPEWDGQRTAFRCCQPGFGRRRWQYHGQWNNRIGWCGHSIELHCDLYSERGLLRLFRIGLGNHGKHRDQPRRAPGPDHSHRSCPRARHCKRHCHDPGKVKSVPFDVLPTDLRGCHKRWPRRSHHFD